MRRMSFTHTTNEILNRSKSVTRRLGWAYLKPGDRLLSVDKLRSKEVRKLAVLEVVDVRLERLDAITYQDVARERLVLHDCSRHSPEVEANCVYCFIGEFCRAMKCQPDAVVTRIEFRYVDDAEALA